VTLAIIALFASAQGKFAVEHSALSFEAKKIKHFNWSWSKLKKRTCILSKEQTF